MKTLPALTQVYVDSAVTTSLTMAIDHYYVVDTAVAAVTLTLPTGVNIGHWIVIQNAPANGPQLGGGTVGNNINVKSGTGETVEGSKNDSALSPPTGPTTAKGRIYFPTGPNSSGSGFGTGWVKK
jgi:hypothetical protein